jgi:hypothetical protein
MGDKAFVYGKGYVDAPGYDTDATLKAQTKQMLDEEPYKSRITKMNQEIADSKAKDAKALAPFNMAKGGKVSSASKRADGCAVRGKTRA